MKDGLLEVGRATKVARRLSANESVQSQTIKTRRKHVGIALGDEQDCLQSIIRCERSVSDCRTDAL